MVDYVLARKSRNILSVAMHIGLNLALGLAAIFSVILLNTPLLGIALVLLSKWRILAVRVRFWWPNIKSNLVDLIVGVSMVLLTYYMQPAPWGVALLMAILYCLWLVVVKPLSSEKAATVQALIAVFLGMSAASIGTTYLDPIVEMMFAFLIGFAASRHILSQGEDQDFTITTLACGLVFAEVAWLCNTWSIVYFLFDVIRIPQVAVILTIFTFVYTYARQAMIRYQDNFRFRHILAPVLFGVILIGILVLGYSDPMFNI